MITVAECKDFIRDYYTNSGFPITDENELDDAARELLDVCGEQDVRPEDLDPDLFVDIIQDYDI